MTRAKQSDVMALAATVAGTEPATARLVEAYLMMAMRCGYRAEEAEERGLRGAGAAANSDTELVVEAISYAERFTRQSFPRPFETSPTDRAFVFAVEGMRVLTAGEIGAAPARRLLRMAVEELDHVERKAKKPDGAIVPDQGTVLGTEGGGL